MSFSQNKGLAVAFQAGLDAALKLGADAIVNTDADNQYRAEDIPELVRPIVENRADFVVGTRNIVDHPEFTWAKKRLQKLGSWVVRTRTPGGRSRVSSTVLLNPCSRWSAAAT